MNHVMIIIHDIMSCYVHVLCSCSCYVHIRIYAMNTHVCGQDDHQLDDKEYT